MVNVGRYTIYMDSMGMVGTVINRVVGISRPIPNMRSFHIDLGTYTLSDETNLNHWDWKMSFLLGFAPPDRCELLVLEV